MDIKEKKKISNKKYRESHKEQIKESHRKWREKNREHINEMARRKSKENPEPFQKRKKKYVESHREQVREQTHKYNIENRQYRTDYERNKRHNDPVYKFRSSVRTLINHYTTGKGYKGTKTTYEILGCSFNELLKYIENLFEEGMTLENYGNGEGKWNIDHIIPISEAIDDTDLENLNHYSNLQPMWSIENSRKGNKR